MADETRGIPRAQLTVVVAALLLSATTFIYSSRINALGVALGGALATLNLWAISRLVRGFLSGQTKLPWALFAAVKVTALFAAIYWLTRLGVPLLWIVLGYATLPLGIVLSQAAGYKATAPKG